MNGINPSAVPPARVVAPYLVAAPLGLAMAGVALLTAPEGTLDGPSTPALLAATHGIVLGWLTMSIMGATLQLTTSVLGGRPPAVPLAMSAFVLYATGVALLVGAFADWRLPLLVAGGGFAVAGLACYLAAAARPLWTARPVSPELTSLRLAHLCLGATVALGLTWALALRFGWFAVTPALVAAHAHLGIIGWLAIAITGVTYRLLPMFGIVRGVTPRFARQLPGALAAMAVVACAVYPLDPPPLARAGLEAVLAALGGVWLADAVRLYRGRLRRKPDLYSRATAGSFLFLGAALAATPLAAAWPADAPPGAHRIVTAAGVLVLGGWAGMTLVANSYKIVPFIAWYHRFSARAGHESVPGTAELYSRHIAHAVLILVAIGTITGAGAALSGALPALRAAGAACTVAGLFATVSLAGTFVVRPVPGRGPGPRPAAHTAGT